MRQFHVDWAAALREVARLRPELAPPYSRTALYALTVPDRTEEKRKGKLERRKLHGNAESTAAPRPLPRLPQGGQCTISNLVDALGTVAYEPHLGQFLVLLPAIVTGPGTPGALATRLYVHTPECAVTLVRLWHLVSGELLPLPDGFGLPIVRQQESYYRATAYGAYTEKCTRDGMIIALLAADAEVYTERQRALEARAARPAARQAVGA
ncbi:MAG: hypothetical protein KKH61_10240 [Gammaproteobacteria bacterium]|nr:hypothetical protein [Gammaproteobacteria bacterium]